jgi:hypothetical protein
MSPIHGAFVRRPAIYGGWVIDTAKYIHDLLKQKVLQWQTGYGVVSFGTGDLPWVVAYIQNQKQHHARAPRTNDWSACHVLTRGQGLKPRNQKGHEWPCGTGTQNNYLGCRVTRHQWRAWNEKGP